MFEDDKIYGERLILENAAEEFLIAARNRQHDSKTRRGLIINSVRCLENVLNMTELTESKAKINIAIRLAEILLQETTNFDYCIEVVGQGQVLARSGRFHPEAIKLGLLEIQVIVKRHGGAVSYNIVEKLDKLIQSASLFDTELVNSIQLYKDAVSPANSTTSIGMALRGFESLKRAQSVGNSFNDILEQQQGMPLIVKLMASMGNIITAIQQGNHDIEQSVEQLHALRSYLQEGKGRISHKQGNIQIEWMEPSELDKWIKIFLSVAMVYNNVRDVNSTQASQILSAIITQQKEHGDNGLLDTACYYDLMCFASHNNWNEFEDRLSRYSFHDLNIQKFLHATLAIIKADYQPAIASLYTILSNTPQTSDLHLTSAINLIFILMNSTDMNLQACCRDIQEKLDPVCSNHESIRIRALWMIVILFHWSPGTTRMIDGVNISNPADYAKALLSLAEKIHSTQLLMFISISCAPYLDTWNQISQVALHGYSLADRTFSTHWKYAANLLVLQSAQSLGTLSHELLSFSSSLESDVWASIL